MSDCDRGERTEVIHHWALRNDSVGTEQILSTISKTDGTIRAQRKSKSASYMQN